MGNSEDRDHDFFPSQFSEQVSAQLLKKDPGLIKAVDIQDIKKILGLKLPETVFTPRYTTAEMKVKTNNPDFVYEISCDQMCGKGHYSMRGTVIVETQAEHEAWLAKQQSYWDVNNAPATPAADTAAAVASTTMNN